MRLCASCGSKNVTTEQTGQSIQYWGHPIDIVVPVHSCADCDFQYTDHIGEAIRQAAIEKHQENKDG